MAQNLTVAGAVSLPLVDGGTVAAINLAATLGLTSRADFCRSYSGAVTNDPVDFGTLTVPGAKGIIALCTMGSATIAFQSTSTPAWPLDPGGYFIWIDTVRPFPTSAFITTTGGATVVFIAVG